MRLERRIELDGIGQVVVRELTPRIVRNLLSQIPDEEELKNMTLLEYAKKFMLDFFEFLGDCIELPNGYTYQDLSYSAIEKIMQAFSEVNEAFFRVQERLLPVPVMQFLNWNVPSSLLANEDIPSPGSGDGDSSQKAQST